ncbi:MAG: hypothetical protein LBT46_04710 [Planctomycetaceae bacterium]|jgi:hypothetical protein|nr:hypothetical protein [Planctomycetaceae bacterium]
MQRPGGSNAAEPSLFFPPQNCLKRFKPRKFAIFQSINFGLLGSQIDLFHNYRRLLYRKMKEENDNREGTKKVISGE